MRFELHPHPQTPPGGVESVAVQVEQGERGLWLEYSVRGAGALVLPEVRSAERTDGLWQTTCFELFFKPDGGDAYVEFNFSPSCQWAAYGFDAYRSGMRELAGAADPEIEVSLDARPWFFLAAEPLPADLFAAQGRLALSAVIEEIDGTRSFWALAHAPGPPDFHNPACFAATLPPPPEP